MPERLKGKIAVVTGAASGIGAATLELFVAEGARVIAADIQPEAGLALQAKHPEAVRFVRCDVSQPEALKAAIDAAAEHFGGLDVLFSNAGRAGDPAGLQDFDPAGWDETHALLLRAVVAGAAYALPHLIRRGGGSIVNTASVAGLQAGYGPLAYSVAKAGVIHFTRLAAAELSAYRVRINAIAPGFIATRIFGDSLGMDPEASERLAQAVAARSGAANPIGRPGLPRDIAEAALYFASDASGFVTGTCLTVDGGLTIGPPHAWDASKPSPMQIALGVTREQAREMRAAAKRRS
jgi:NAD(P)-dependent dehydrogenase (short-subunit alcohol dehydrogenase family)